MSSSGATPTTAPTWLLGRSRARDGAGVVPAAESVAFAELVWAHHLYEREVHTGGELHGPAEAEYRTLLDRFTREQGRIINAYWCTSKASAVALTERPGGRLWGFLWRRRPDIRYHSATDWVTGETADLGHVLHTCETLAIRVSEVLSSTSERIAMQWLLSVAGYALGVVDQADGKPTAKEAALAARRARAELAQVEAYYDRAGEKMGRLIYFWGMMIGVAALAVLAVAGSLVYSLFGNLELMDPETQRFFVCYAMGAVGAIVSVMTRMSSGPTGAFELDYEVGRQALRRVGSFRPFIGAIFAVVLYFALRSQLIQLQTVPGAQTTYFYAALAFFAGFSERRAKILLGGAERVFGLSGSELPPTPPPAGSPVAGSGGSG